MKLFCYFWSEITNSAPLTLRVTQNHLQCLKEFSLGLFKHFDASAEWNLEHAGQSLPKSNIKIKCAFTISLWIIGSLERSFDSKLNSRQFRFTVAMFIKQGAASKRPIAANYGMKFYSTTVLLPTDELEDHFVLS